MIIKGGMFLEDDNKRRDVFRK